MNVKILKSYMNLCEEFKEDGEPNFKDLNKFEELIKEDVRK